MSGVLEIARTALRESVRRRVFAVVAGLTALFGGLYTLATYEVFQHVTSFSDPRAFVDEHTFAGATMVGLAMFGTLFLGAILAVFLTIGAVRGDAERGLLQPLVVRPLGRPAYVLGRLLAAGAVSGGYCAFVFLAAVVVTGVISGWWPGDVAGPALGLALGAVVISALSLLASVFLSATANGIAVLMAFGGGVVAGLAGQIGHALDSHSLERIANVASWALPFEALYQSGLRDLTANVGGIAGEVVKLGPFGRATGAGPLLWPWVIAYVALAVTLAAMAFERKDL